MIWKITQDCWANGLHRPHQTRYNFLKSQAITSILLEMAPMDVPYLTQYLLILSFATILARSIFPMPFRLIMMAGTKSSNPYFRDCNATITQYELSIYNRWGELVFLFR